MAERDTSLGGEGVKPSGYPSSTESPARSTKPQGTSAGTTDTATGLKQKMSEDARTVQQAAKNGLSQASDKAKDVADDQKNIIATQLSGLASAIEKVGTELEEGDQRTVGNMTKRLGTGMRKAAEDLKDRNLGQIASMAEDFGRRQPAAFLGIAALAGFAASRFLAATSHRETTNTAMERRLDPANMMAHSSSMSVTAPSPKEDRPNG